MIGLTKDCPWLKLETSCVTALFAFALALGALANPVGMTVQNGTATTSVSGSLLNVTASQNAVLNWQSFNIGAGETTTFQQPSASSIVWNRINDQNPSQIYGNLNANGVVVLMNQSGFYFGPDSMVRAAGFVASTANGVPLDCGGGLFWQFTGPPPRTSIINFGQINLGPGGSAFLIAQHVENHGTISAPQGSIGLLSGHEVLLSSRPDGLGLSAQVLLPAGSVDNSGRLVADAGTIAMHAQVVNQNGQVQANSIRQHDGVIELSASETATLGASSVMEAHGDAGASTGGRIQITSAGSFADTTSSRINVSGGEQGGNGGQVEISAPVLPAIHSQIDGHANGSGIGGRLSIDPTDIILSTVGSGSAGSGSVNANDPPGTLQLDVNSAFVGFSQIDLQAKHNIQLTPGTTWDLAQSTGIASPGSHLTLEAGNDIIIGDSANLLAGPGWSVTLQAGRNFSSPDGITPGIGSITFQGSGALQAQDGSVSLLAGENVSVGSGFVRTMNGGSIEVTALSGSVNTGTRPNGFNFLPISPGYIVDPNLGGISTANGGNVSITAGLDITSYLPPASGVPTDGGSGAFGVAPGNVTLTAGHDVVGHFVVCNGIGSITAGHDAGISTLQLALSLVSGGWNVTAGNDILLQEVRNPNGIFNNLGFGSSLTRHAFDYSADAYTVLNAGDAVQLTGSALPRNDDNFERDIPPIYPGRLEITAGSGGVTLGNDVTLFPSPQGELRITTTDGGSLVGAGPGDLTQLVMSDSGNVQYRATGDFGLNDHAATPVQLNNPNPIEINISGDLDNVLIGAPKFAQINVGGNMINSRFDGQNLHAGDVTSIHVAGDILNRNDFTSVPLAAPPNFAIFDYLYPALPPLLANLPNQFSYNPVTKTLTFQGRMSNDQLQALLNLQVQVFDQFGQPVYDAQGNPVTRPVQFTDPATLQQLFAKSQDIPLNPNTGYRLGGGGEFDITARNLDLGATAGIVSQGPLANPALANYFTRGANINVTLSGNLDMFSTTISSLNGGNVTVVAGGSINVGSKDFLGNDNVARGIFTVDQSDVTVIAHGDIEVNGSRIAAYDGGNVTVQSLAGNVDAGTGGLGSVPVEEIYVDPVTHAINTYTPTIPGSGILATTLPPSSTPLFPNSEATVGNILVETPLGNIIASAGGIVQLPLNGVNNSAGLVTLDAGSRDAAGNVIFAGNIDLTGSGVIGSTVKLNATGSIEGLVVARGNIDIIAQQNVNVTALAQGNVNISSGGTIGGTLIGIGGINASGANVDAALLSESISTSGNVTSSQVGFSQGTAANATSQSLANDESQSIIASAKKGDQEDELKKKTASALPHLTKTLGRVTVILPEE
jgi:filamentous hemagglutinin family protein